MRGIKGALGRLRRCAFRLVAGIFREDILAWNEALRERERRALERDFFCGSSVIHEGDGRG